MLSNLKNKLGTNIFVMFLCISRPLFYILNYESNKVADIASGGGLSLVINTKVPGQASQLWYFDKQGFLRSAVNDFGVGSYTCFYVY